MKTGWWVMVLGAGLLTLPTGRAQAGGDPVAQFYIHLRDEMSKAAALRQAQIEVRADYPNPYYWSGFVLSGDPGRIEPEREETAATQAVGLPDRSPPPAEPESEAGQSRSRCLSLLMILGLMGSMGLVIKRGDSMS